MKVEDYVNNMLDLDIYGFGFTKDGTLTLVTRTEARTTRAFSRRRPLMSPFKIGSKVRWSSQGNGTHLEKLGVIVEVVALGDYPKNPNVSGSPRKGESYVVEVSRASSRGYRKPSFYWPRVTALRPW